ncbi:MAG TPA: acyltransferase [Bryobacteraceae bacterium]|nr:acyltransferase [Bryobacteraceae bacterium]
MRTARQVATRFDGIDILRGISILAVVVHHTFLRLRAGHVGLEPMASSPWAHLLFWNGNPGVTVFFAVSGFLITFTSIRRFGALGKVSPRVFYRFRFARIAPLLLALLVVLSILDLLHTPVFTINSQRTNLPRALFAALTFHLNWLEAVRGYLPPSWDVLWSLSVEEMFYLFFPLVCLALLRFLRGQGLFVALLIGFFILGPFARTSWAFNEIWKDDSYLGGMDAIALGCLTAMLVHALRSRRQHLSRLMLVSIQLSGAGLLLLIGIAPHWDWMRPLGDLGLVGTLLAIGTCMVMAATVLRGIQGSRWTAPIRWFGRHSYEVYLTHEFVVIWTVLLYVRWQHGPLPLWFAAILILSAALGALIARYFTEPLNARLRSNPQHAILSRAQEPEPIPVLK